MRNDWRMSRRRPSQNTCQGAWRLAQQSWHIAIGAKLYYCGGGTPPNSIRTDRFKYYDMDKDRFVLLGTMPKPRCCAGPGVVRGKLYMTAGFYNDPGDRCPKTWGYPFPNESCCSPAS